MSYSYETYAAAAKIASKWELPHEMLDNGIVIHHIPQNTTKANIIVNDIRRKAISYGLTAKSSWIDGWTVKITWGRKGG